jgi:hypothetical protein
VIQQAGALERLLNSCLLLFNFAGLRLCFFLKSLARLPQ